MWSVARWSTLLLATILTGPALWHGLVVRDMDFDTAITRFLIGVLVSAVMLAVLRTVTADYRKPPAPKSDEDKEKDGDGKGSDPDAPRRRTEDTAEGESRIDRN